MCNGGCCPKKMRKHSAGKGDSPRPKSISDKEYSQRFEAVFGQKRRWFDDPKHNEWANKK